MRPWAVRRPDGDRGSVVVRTLLILVGFAALPGAAWSQTGRESLSPVPTQTSKAHIGEGIVNLM